MIIVYNSVFSNPCLGIRTHPLTLIKHIRFNSSVWNPLKGLCTVGSTTGLGNTVLNSSHKSTESVNQ